MLIYSLQFLFVTKIIKRFFENVCNETKISFKDPNNRQRSVSILVYKTLNSVFRSGRKIIIRVCEVASAKNVKSHKMFNLYSSMNRRGATEEKDQRDLETTGHDRFCQTRLSR